MTVMKVLKKKVWKCLLERKVVDIVLLKPDTINQLMLEGTKVVDIGIKIPATSPLVISEVVEVGQL